MIEKLTPREIDVFHLIIEGESNIDIATSLKISVKTTEKYVGNILKKNEFKSRKKLIVSYWKMRVEQLVGKS